MTVDTALLGALDDDVVLLLDAFGAAAAAPAGAPDAPRERLLARVAASAAAARPMHTVRAHRCPLHEVAPGVRVRTLYEASGAPQRRGEPQRVLWAELAPGARWAGGWSAGALQRDWLVVAGSARIDGVALGTLDYRVMPAGSAVGEVRSDSGATLVLREAPLAAPGDGRPLTAADEPAAWHDFTPGIRRRLLWVHDGEAAMLYRAAPGAAVPRHRHGRDEECLMLDGELFLDDVLLRGADYQLAPQGSGHGGLQTDTGGVVYAHGDVDLDLC